MKISARHVLFASAALAALGFNATAAQAQAQAQAPAAPAAPASANDVLGEVVVTATRRADTVSRVPLSITAVTEKALDQQGIRNVTDLARSVPALSFRRTGSDGTTNVAIRGIFASAGAPTTGVYLDDTPLQKRFASGAVPGNGNPYPELFDLERVEVLRGPQGTLYGGSSEGGTVRFITPQPSLTRYSAYVRADANTVNLGGVGGELGVAVGGPIVQDKVGFRGSLQYQHVGGYLDHVDYLTGRTTMSDTNYEDHWAGRIAVTFAPTDKLKITPAFYGSRVKINDIDSQWGNVPSYTVPTRYYGPTGAVATPATATYVQPGYTYPALNFYGRGKTGQPNTSSRYNVLNLGTLTIDYDLGPVTVKSITSLLQDGVVGSFDQTAGEETNLYGYFGGYVYLTPQAAGTFKFTNDRHGVTQEVRFASAAGPSPLSWVAGVFYSDMHTNGTSGISETLNLLTTQLRGVSSTVYYKGVPPLPPFPGGPGELVSYRNQNIQETEIAGFGEANYNVTDKLKLTAGVRVSHDVNKYYVNYFGQLAGWNVATLANGGITEGQINETPVTPKVGISYQIDSKDMVYFTAAKGYRPGGVNQTVPAVYCAAGLAAIGTPPLTYNSDTVMSYEAGAKVRVLGDRAQINTSVFYVDWSNIQLNASVPGCPFSYVTNAGKAVSKGFDLQSNARLGYGFTMNLGVGYTDATYSQTTFGPPNTPRAILVNKGDQLPVAPWNVSLGLQYDTTIMDGHGLYVRADYQYASPYHRSVGPGATGYTPDTYLASETRITNFRLGTTFANWDLSVYANNLFDNHDKILNSTGRSGCTSAACTGYSTISYLDVFNTFRPRTVGVTATYRY